MLKVTEKDHGWEKLGAFVKAFRDRKATVKAGVLGQEANRDDGLDNVKLAAIHEFGVPEKNIPERSFIRVPFDANRLKYQEQIKQLLADILAGKGDVRRGLARIGLQMAADMRARIQRGVPTPLEPLKPGTIAKKGSSRPLIDTGQLVRSITHEVEIP